MKVTLHASWLALALVSACVSDLAGDSSDEHNETGLAVGAPPCKDVPTPCAIADCPEGTTCHLNGNDKGNAVCIPDEDPCDAANCPEGTTCYRSGNDSGDAVCVPDQDPCDAANCPEGTTCYRSGNDSGDAVCVPDQGL